MTKNTLLVVAGMLAMFTTTAFAAPNYIEARPLADVIKQPVGSVSGGTTIVPIITWGGDIATIYGNGNKRTTAASSIFSDNGLTVKLQREDKFQLQVARYMSGESPYLRGTLGMINAAADVLGRDDRTKPVVIYQSTWSVGGDALTVKPGIKNAKGLRGKTIALQAYGPHVDYLAKILSGANLTLSDVNIKWLPDLTGTDDSPMSAFYESDVDAAFVIIPDALALTSGGNVGTGSEDSVKGAKILLSTKTASKVIADVYAVRSDYLKSNRNEVANFVRALLQSEEALGNLSDKSPEFKRTMRAAADILLDSPQAVTDAEGLYADAQFVHYSGNVSFFEDKNNLRNFSRLNAEIQKSFSNIGLTTGRAKLTQANWDYASMKQGLSQVVVAEAPKFNKVAVSRAVNKKLQDGSLEESGLFSFEVLFKPNQKEFPEALYKESLDKVLELSSAFAGALMTVEGHSDPLEYLKKNKAGAADVVLSRVKQSARNLSISRAQKVRDTIIAYAKKEGVSIDPSQFEEVGHGIAQPKTGICSGKPCAPKTEQEWLSNMRVVFRIIQIEAEADVFTPL